MQQAHGLLAQHRGLAQFAAGCQLQQRLIRHGRPQKVGQARGDFVTREDVVFLLAIQELRRAQDGFDAFLNGCFGGEAALLRGAHEFHERSHFAAGGRPAPRARRKALQHRARIRAAIRLRAEYHAMAFRRPRVVERSLDFDPGNPNAGRLEPHVNIEIATATGFVRFIKRKLLLAQQALFVRFKKV